MAASVIVAVRSALVAALAPIIQGVVGMEDVYVGFQYPIGNAEPREAIWTQNPQLDLRSASLRAGRNFLNESTSFDLVFKSWAPNRTAEEAAQRVIDIAEVATAWIGDHKNNELGVPGLQTLTVSGGASQTETLDNDSITGRLQVPVTYTARLT
jgi:hypothetical protein